MKLYLNITLQIVINEVVMVDAIDKQLIARLQEDGRATFTDLGKSLGLSHVWARARLNRLLRDESIKISANLSAEKLNMKTAVIFVEAESFERLRELVKAFKDCPRLIFMSTLMGAHNLIAVIVAEDSSTLESMVVGTCSLRSQKGIRRSEAHVSETTVYPSHLPVRLKVDKSDIAPCHIPCNTCERYENNKCLGCPATQFYRGPL